MIESKKAINLRFKEKKKKTLRTQSGVGLKERYPEVVSTNTLTVNNHLKKYKSIIQGL